MSMKDDFRPSTNASDAIGFRELRQACEISVLREDLERLRRDTGALRDHIEEVVETVRARFAELTPEEFGDPAQMVPLLQFAIMKLVAIREKARQTELPSGALADEGRTGWDPTAPDGSSRPEPRPEREPRPVAAPPPPPPPPPPEPPVPSTGDGWLSAGETGPPHHRPAPTPLPVRETPTSAAVDWLAPRPR
jgi:hypothetical protein